MSIAIAGVWIEEAFRKLKFPTPWMLVMILGELILKGMRKHYDGKTAWPNLDPTLSGACDGTSRFHGPTCMFLCLEQRPQHLCPRCLPQVESLV